MSEATAKHKANKGTINPQFNPFPGLRPFGIEESHLFFGREGQSDEILNNLAENRFVAVMGASGSGKSSLIYCGLVPILHGGFITSAGSNWRVIAARPGGGPIDNLATAIVNSELDSDASVEEKSIQKNITSTVLRSSSLGLIESVKQLKKEKGENVLFIIDQFEELFRFKNSQEDHTNTVNESAAFVKLLLTAIKQSEVPIYVVLTMRSDFIGDCAQFQQLTKAINDSNFLIPQMTREDFKTAIEGPVAVGGGKISARLVQQLLNDVGDNQDQLPILQHAMMRTWDYWIENRTGDEVIDINHYQAIGQMGSALSEHANEAFDELSEEEKRVCESMFKTLTEKGGDNRGIRHPTQVRKIAEIAMADEKSVISVVNTFRAQGRSFLTPSIEIPLRNDSVIDISHESLMRIWDRLKIWVEEEGNAVNMYLRLSDAAEMYQLGKTGLWRPPDLQLALNWKEKQNPTLAWARRFNPAFERTMVYLETSYKEFQAEEENKIRLQKRALRRTRIFAMILGSAAIISIGVMLYAFMLQIRAEDERIKAEEARKQAILNEQEAQKQTKLAKESEDRAVAAKKDSEIQREEAERQAILAQLSEEKAREQSRIALQNAREAKRQSELALQNEKIAKEEQRKAEIASDSANGLRMLSIARSMSVKSLQIKKDLNQKALVAYQAYKFNDEYGGKAHDNDIYNGLYHTLKLTNKTGYNRLEGHQDAVRAVVYNSDGSKLYTAGSDGKIISWNALDQQGESTVILRNSTINRCLAISSNDRWLACGSGRNIQLIELNNTKSPIILNGHNGNVWSLKFTPDNKYLISSGADSTILMWQIGVQSSTPIAKLSSNIRSIDIDYTGKRIVGGTEDGKLLLWSKDLTAPPTVLFEEKDNPIYAVKFSNSGKLLATGDIQGAVVIWDMQTKQRLITLTGHDARINDIQFSEDDKMMATASYDGKVQLWETNDLNAQPIVLSDHSSWVWSIAFNPKGNELISGCVDNLIRKYPTQSNAMADEMCSKITRNLGKKEWVRFVGKDIEYRRTCQELPPGEGIEESNKTP
jgi:WD40 repeat protein/energy-coupling factor transporter ATP-binding protein EcfA2